MKKWSCYVVMKRIVSQFNWNGIFLKEILEKCSQIGMIPGAANFVF